MCDARNTNEGKHDSHRIRVKAFFLYKRVVKMSIFLGLEKEVIRDEGTGDTDL